VQSVSYWEAWSLWWSGQKVDGMRMWGVPLLWWGRVGKVMQFGGGLIAILDLIGSERLNRAAGNVHRKARLIRRDARRTAHEKPPVSAEKRFGVLWTSALIGANVLGLVVLFAVRGPFALLGDWYARGSLIAVVVMAAVVFASGLLVIALLYLLLRTAHLPFVALAWVFGSGRPGHPMRWVAFGFVLTGFHFDLLAS
jgi:hypothetical protein